MGEPTESNKVLRVLAAFSRHEEALNWTESQAERCWGRRELASPRFLFSETDYYTSSMGEPLIKTFWAFAELTDPSGLADWKLACNRWEQEYAAAANHGEARPLNIDPGYLTLAKLVLASTKDHAHRVYLRDGIYAEVTLYYRNRGWCHSDWTYPDYQRDDFQAFFTECREYLRGQLQQETIA